MKELKDWLIERIEFCDFKLNTTSEIGKKMLDINQIENERKYYKIVLSKIYELENK